MCVASFSTAVLIKARLAGVGSLSIQNEEIDPTNRTRDLPARGFRGFGCAKAEFSALEENGGEERKIEHFKEEKISNLCKTFYKPVHPIRKHKRAVERA